MGGDVDVDFINEQITKVTRYKDETLLKITLNIFNSQITECP